MKHNTLFVFLGGGEFVNSNLRQAPFVLFFCWFFLNL